LTSPAPRVATNALPAATRLILNPLSFRMSRGRRHDRLQACARDLGIRVAETATEAELAAAIEALVADPPERVIVCGGDGTVQALITALADLDEHERPDLLILGGGRTNYTARDLATHNQPEHLLSRAADPQFHWRRSTRHSLILRQQGQPDRHGFFVAGALLDDVIRDCHRYRQQHRQSSVPWLHTGHASSAWRVSQLGVQRLLGRRRFPAHPMAIDAEGLDTLSGELKLVLMTTLEHRGQTVNPYAERGQGALRLTATRADAEGFWRRLPRLLRGRYHRSMTPSQGYLSGRCSRATFTGLNQVCLDGQEHDYRGDRTLEVVTGPAFRFLHP